MTTPPPPDPVKKPPSDSGRALNLLWSAQSIFGLFKSVFDAIDPHIPQFLHGVTVSVVGGPSGDLRRAWFMACAIAFGRIRRSPTLAGGSATMQATWDVTNKVAQIELVYQCAKMAYSEDQERPSETLKRVFGPSQFSGVSKIIAGMAVPAAALPVPAPSPKTSPIALIQMGPDQLTVGAGWPGFLLAPGQNNTIRAINGPAIRINQDAADVRFTIRQTGSSGRGAGTLFANVLREFPSTGGSGGATFLPYQVISPLGVQQPSGTPVSPTEAPTLPDDGRVITSGEKRNRTVQPPKPPIDGATRTTLVALVAASLTTPCYLPLAVPTTNTPLYSTGLQVYAEGRSPNYPEAATLITAAKAFPGAGVLPDIATDGYLPLPSVVTDQRD